MKKKGAAKPNEQGLVVFTVAFHANVRRIHQHSLTPFAEVTPRGIIYPPKKAAA